MLAGAGALVAATVPSIHVPPRIHIDFEHVRGLALVVGESLVGAAFYGLSSVLQHSAARQVPEELSLRPGLIFRLLRSGRWLLGNLADVGGFVFQFLALRRGSLALVQPLFVTSLVFSLAGNAIVERRRLTRPEWTATLSIVLGLGLFLALARPGAAHPRASPVGWISLGSATVLAVGASVALAGHSPRRRPLMLGIATGILYGVTAAITERTGFVLDGGVLHALTFVAPYALAVTSITGLLLNQSAFQAGRLSLSLPVITVLEPVVAIAIGLALFGEHIHTGGWAPLAEVLGMTLMAVGVVGLARDPAIVPLDATTRPPVPEGAEGVTQGAGAVPNGTQERVPRPTRRP